MPGPVRLKFRMPAIDLSLAAATLALIVIGLLTVYSATSVPGAHEGLWIKQLQWAGLAIGAAWIAAVGGGLMAVGVAAVLAWRARRERAVGRMAPASTASANTIPYAPAIVAGVWLVEFALG